MASRSPGMAPPGGWRTEESIWQLVECCDYVADLPVWSELCSGKRVLDLGCGIGRVAHHLAESGCEVLGLDRDPLMVEDFNRRAPEGARAAWGDVLDWGPDLGLFDVVIAPQQLIQIIGGESQRSTFLELIARSLEPAGIAAITLVEDLPTESAAPVLTPDIREIDDWVYSSRPTALVSEAERITVERLRQRIAPDGTLDESKDRIGFTRLTRDSLLPEFKAAGLILTDRLEIPRTQTHMGSSVLVLQKR